MAGFKEAAAETNPDTNTAKGEEDQAGSADGTLQHRLSLGKHHERWKSGCHDASICHKAKMRSIAAATSVYIVLFGLRQRLVTIPSLKGTIRQLGIVHWA